MIRPKYDQVERYIMETNTLSGQLIKLDFAICKFIRSIKKKLAL